MTTSTQHTPTRARGHKLAQLSALAPHYAPAASHAKPVAIGYPSVISAPASSAPLMSSRWKQRARVGLHEAATMARASVSSAGATFVDGIVYQLVLSLLIGHYGAAAFLGAMIGGVTNFTINRVWAFPNSAKPLGAQATEYALASLTTYVALQSCLFVLVELIHTDQRVAWIPAKIAAWLFVSYPLQRFLVFGTMKPRTGRSLAMSVPPVSSLDHDSI